MLKSICFYSKTYFRAFLIIVILGYISSCSGGGNDDSAGSSGPNLESNTQGKDLQTKEYNLLATNPKNSVIRISNNSNNVISFYIELNGNKFYNNLDEVINDIKKMKDEYPGEKIVRKVWRYTRDNTYHNPPLTEKYWYHNPMLILNSPGFGFCDDVAMLNCFIWTNLGYKARMWGLKGHAVSEVYVDGRWELYDSDLGIYYHNQRLEVAGVEELRAYPNLVTSPIKPIITDKEAAKATNIYSKEVAIAYSDPNNYFIDFNLIANVTDTKFHLPPASKIEFGGKIISNATTGMVSNQKYPIADYANLVYTINYSSNGVLPFPFIIQTIHSKGKITHNDKEFIIGSKALENLLSSYDDLVFPLLFDTQEPIEVVYYINPIRFSIQNQNKLVLRGKYLDFLNVEIVPNENI